jgi:H+/Cl- antiporter ClcA
MPFRFDPREPIAAARELIRWLLLVTPLALAIGSACALFLWGLDHAVHTFLSHPALLWALPFAGLAVAWLYQTFGNGSEGGNNLLIDAVHNDDSPLVPRRMAPLILITTWTTHLFGGSAGREGTAIQMGGALAAAWGRALRLDLTQTRTLLLCGLAAGFAGVFGTPLAGCVFALEVLAIGRVKTQALVPCLIAALVSNWTVGAWGLSHIHYQVTAPANATLDPVLALKIAIASIAFGLAAMLFAELTHGLGQLFKGAVKNPLLRPFYGGLLLIALTYALGTRDYLGLGTIASHPGAITISSAFETGGADNFSWFWKLAFTALTLSSGFKGGEVTPLFFIGATLGNSLSKILQTPTDLMAALGFVAVFAGASNTPLACTLLGIELFGAANAPYYALACFLSCLWSGHSGIYLSQRIESGKSQGLPTNSTLREARENRKPLLRRNIPPQA